jgi:hypothetical protein
VPFVKRLLGKKALSHGVPVTERDASADFVEASVVDKLTPETRATLESLGIRKDETNLLVALATLEAEAVKLDDELTEPLYGHIVSAFVIPDLKYIDRNSHATLKYAISAFQAAGHQRLINNVTPDPSGMFYLAGIGDLEIVRQHLKAYELADFAHVENVLAGEHRERTHRRLELTEEQLQELEEKISESERDLQTTERSETQIEAERTINEEINIEAGVTASYYGPNYNITASVNGGYNRQSTSTARRATNFAQDVVQRAVDRVKNRTLRDLRRRKLKEIEETNVHGVNNAHPDAQHIRGIYRWLNKIYDAQVYNYGKRQLLDFVIPEPAAFYIWSLSSPELESSQIQIPEEPDFGPADIQPWNWRGKVKLYRAQGVKPPPGNMTFSWAKGNAGDNPKEHMDGTKIAIDDGWEAHEVSVRSNWVSLVGESVNQNFFIADAVENNRHWTLGANNKHRHELGVAHFGMRISAYAFKIDVICRRTEEAFRQWQVETFEAVMDGYRRLKAEYEDRLASAAIGEGIAIAGKNPELNKQLIQSELQRCCTTLLTEQSLEGFNPFRGGSVADGRDYWRFMYDRVKEHAIDVRFFQHAFEWHNMTYICYPNFWGRSASWANRLIEYDDPDPHFAAFLRAGAARVQVPVREGFEEAVLHFAETGELLEGDEIPVIDDPLYVSALEEIKESLGSLADAIPDPDGPWEVKAPTSLVVLQGADEVQFLDALDGTTVTLPFNTSIAEE